MSSGLLAGFLLAGSFLTSSGLLAYLLLTGGFLASSRLLTSRFLTDGKLLTRLFLAQRLFFLSFYFISYVQCNKYNRNNITQKLFHCPFLL